MEAADVRQERERVQAMANCEAGQAIIVRELRKTYPAQVNLSHACASDHMQPDLCAVAATLQPTTWLHTTPLLHASRNFAGMPAGHASPMHCFCEAAAQ